MDELVIFSLLAADLRKNEWKEAKRFTIINSHYFAVGFCINVRSISWHTGTQDIWCHLVTANCQVYLDVTTIFIMFSLHIKDLDGRGGRHMGKQGGWHYLKCSYVTRHERLWSSVQNSKLVDTDLQMLSYLIQDDCVVLLGFKNAERMLKNLKSIPQK